MSKKITEIDVKEIKKLALAEAVKLILRLYVFSIVPVVLLIILSGINTATGELSINWLVVRNVFLFESISFIIAGMDKFKHEYLSAIDPVANKGKSMGIVKF